jgi:hypothetical protein
MSFEDPFAGIESKPVEKKVGGRKMPAKKTDTFQAPLAVTRQDAIKATGVGKGIMHGKQYQLTTRIPIEVVDELREWAANLGMTQQDLQRYCFYRGLEALEAGERPEFEEVLVQRKLKRPSK